MQVVDPMRFLHLADLHLDTSFFGRSDELRARLREAGRRALENAVEQALASRVDAVLIAGDLFDGERLSFRTERFLLRALGRLLDAGVTVVYATGNHDPGGTTGPASRIPWPEAVHLIPDPQHRQVPIYRGDALVGRVTGAGHDSPRVADDLSLGFPTPQGDVPEVALLHTQVAGAAGSGDHDRYAPSGLDHLRSAGYDYWALGHIHQRQSLSRDPAIEYAGNTQGRHPGETGPRGGLLVEVERGLPPRIEFVELGAIRWETMVLDDLVDLVSRDAILDRLAETWSARRRTDPGLQGAEWILRVELSGATALHEQLHREEDLHEMGAELAGILGLLDVEVRNRGLHPPLDPGRHMKRVDVLGEALRLGLALSGEDGPPPSQLLEITRAELTGAPEDPEELDPYLRRLLAGQLPTILDLLLEEER
jgi:DNA repair protein SbcD/Mre11